MSGQRVEILTQRRRLFQVFLGQVSFNGIVAESFRNVERDEFFSDRGVELQSMEVTSFSCADTRTGEILQEIIQETTNRMNRLSQAESENEVNLFRTQGQIEQEKLNTELLEIQYQHSQTEARVSGQSEADKVSAFLNGLTATVPKLEERMSMWQTLRKTDALSVIASGGASLYYTPNDVNLSIETKGSS